MDRKCLFRRLITMFLTLFLAINLLPVSSLTVEAAETVYDLWIGSTQVTSKNMDRINCGSGYAKYDPTSNILTFSNATSIKGTHPLTDTTNCMIYTKMPIRVKGTATLSTNDPNAVIFASDHANVDIMNANLSFSGGKHGIYCNSGSLLVYGGDNHIKVRNSTYGITVRYDSLFVEGGDIDIDGTDYGIYGEPADFTFEGGKISVKAKKEAISTDYTKSITLKNKLVVSTPDKYGIMNVGKRKAIIDGNSQIAKTVIMDDTNIYNLGEATFDLTSGTQKADSDTIDAILRTLMSCKTEPYARINTDNYNIDLDGDNHYDIHYDNNDSSKGLSVLPTSNLFNETYIIELTSSEILDANDGHRDFYRKITFKFSDKVSDSLNRGGHTVDLSKGSVDLADKKDLMPMESFLGVCFKLKTIPVLIIEETQSIYMDLDKDGSYDIKCLIVMGEDDEFQKITIEALPTNSVKSSITVSLDAEAKALCNSMGLPFYSSVTFVFKAPVVENAPAHTVGEIVTNDNASYKITSVDDGAQTITYVKTDSKKATNVSVPDAITIDGQEYKVTEIADNAFKNNKKLKKVTIGKNITKIGKNAFSGCKNLKTVKINTVLLTKKSVGKNAFKGINEKAKVKVPKKMLKSYKNILKSRGIKGANQKITK